MFIQGNLFNTLSAGINEGPVKSHGCMCGLKACLTDNKNIKFRY